MGWFFRWWGRRSAWLRYGLPLALIATTVVLWFGYELFGFDQPVFWPWGSAGGVLLALIGLKSASY
jgi:hypothetical protein